MWARGAWDYFAEKWPRGTESVGWIGIAEKKPERAKEVAEKIGADFVTSDHRELLARPEVNAAIIATDEHLHVDPVMCALERGIPLMIEKPLATQHRGIVRRCWRRLRSRASMRWSDIRSGSAGGGWRRRKKFAPGRWAM